MKGIFTALLSLLFTVGVLAQPTVNAGPDRSMTYPTSSLTMLGSATGAGTLTYQWSKRSGPYSYTLVNAGDPGTVLQDLTEGTYVFRLTVTDGNGQSAYDELSVVVNANAAAIVQPTGTVATVNYKRVTFTADGTGEYDTWNIVEKLPDNYNPTAGTVYPVIIYFPMLGNEGRDFNMITENGPHKFMKGTFSNGTANPSVWDGKVTTGGTTYDPIVISIQPITAWPESKWLVGAFNYVLSNYKVDLNRVYVTGGSMGGWSTLRVWSYSQQMANKITAFVTISAVAPCNSPFSCLQKTMAGQALVYWQRTEAPYNSIATDNPVMVQVIQNYNSNKSDAIYGQQTDIGDGSHGYWDYWFDPARTQPSVTGLGTYKNYEWLFTKSFNNSLPPTQAPTAEAGVDRFVQLPTSSLTVDGAATGGTAPLNYQWTKVSGPSNYLIQTPTQATTGIYQLTEGTYIFRLTVTDANGLSNYDELTVIVSAATEPPTQSTRQYFIKNKGAKLKVKIAG